MSESKIETPFLILGELGHSREYKNKLAVKEACEKAEIAVPEEVKKFLDEYGDSNFVDLTSVCEPSNFDFVINLSKIPKDIKQIKIKMKEDINFIT